MVEEAVGADLPHPLVKIDRRAPGNSSLLKGFSDRVHHLLLLLLLTPSDSWADLGVANKPHPFIYICLDIKHLCARF